MAESRLCSIPDCGKPTKHCGLCNSHYKRKMRHGDPRKGRTPLGEPMLFLKEKVLNYEGDDCVLWPYAANPAGYGQIRINGVTVLVSRYICERVNGPPSGCRNEAAHTCHNGAKGCVTKGHLVWKTRGENEADKIANGTSNRGERCGAAKITEEDVREIRRLLKTTIPQKDIAAMFDISETNVTAIKQGTIWSHLP